MKTIGILALFLTACGRQSNNTASNNSPDCPCDSYPIPVSCASQCQLADVTVKSIDAGSQVATVEVQQAGKAVQEKVPMAQLPAQTLAGARLSSLLKIDPSSGNSRVVKYLPELKIVAPKR